MRRQTATLTASGPARRERCPMSEITALLGAHLMPLSAQFLAALRRHLPEALKRFSYPLLLFWREAFELLPALT